MLAAWCFWKHFKSQSPIGGQVQRTRTWKRRPEERGWSQSPISGQVRRTSKGRGLRRGARQVTKPYQRAGATDAQIKQRMAKLASSQSPISGQVRRTREMICRHTPCSGHKALSAGRCDGPATGDYGAASATGSQSPISGQVRRTTKWFPAKIRRASHKALSAGRCDGQCLLQPLPRLPFRGGKGERGQKPGRKCVHHPSEKSSCDLSMRCSGVNPTITTAVFSKSNKREALESSTSRAGLSCRRGARSAGQKYCRRASARVLAPAGG
jgi:hypothetical protein